MSASTGSGRATRLFASVRHESLDVRLATSGHGELTTGFSELRGEMAVGRGALDRRIGRQNGVLVSVLLALVDIGQSSDMNRDALFVLTRRLR